MLQTADVLGVDTLAEVDFSFLLLGELVFDVVISRGSVLFVGEDERTFVQISACISAVIRNLQRDVTLYGISFSLLLFGFWLFLLADQGAWEHGSCIARRRLEFLDTVGLLLVDAVEYNSESLARLVYLFSVLVIREHWRASLERRLLVSRTAEPVGGSGVRLVLVVFSVISTLPSRFSI